MEIVNGVPTKTGKPLNGSDVPFGVVTVNTRVPVTASDAMLIVMGRLVSEAPAEIVAVTPVPLKETAIGQLRLLPAIFAEIVAP